MYDLSSHKCIVITDDFDRKFRPFFFYHYKVEQWPEIPLRRVVLGGGSSENFTLTSRPFIVPRNRVYELDFSNGSFPPFFYFSPFGRYIRKGGWLGSCATPPPVMPFITVTQLSRRFDLTLLSHTWVNQSVNPLNSDCGHRNHVDRSRR